MEQKLAIEGWFETEPEPRLLGTRCTECGTFFFPKEELYCRNPGCTSTSFEEAKLSNRGTLWSFTQNHYKPPPPYIGPERDDFEPYTVAAVELADEKMVVLGQMAAEVPFESLRAGMPVELVIEPLYEQDGAEYLTWKWKPSA